MWRLATSVHACTLWCVGGGKVEGGYVHIHGMGFSLSSVHYSVDGCNRDVTPLHVYLGMLPGCLHGKDPVTMTTCLNQSANHTNQPCPQTGGCLHNMKNVMAIEAIV